MQGKSEHGDKMASVRMASRTEPSLARGGVALPDLWGERSPGVELRLAFAGFFEPARAVFTNRPLLARGRFGLVSTISRSSCGSEDSP